MGNLESLLRDEFHEAPVFDDVSVADLIDGARAGRRRRTVRHGLVGVIVAALLIGVGVTLANRPWSARPQPVSPPPHTYVVDRQFIEVERYGMPVEGIFLDARHGWVLVERCPMIETPDPEHPTIQCADFVEATANGGKTFTEHALPTSIEPQVYHLHLYVFDATHLVLAQSVGGDVGSSQMSPPPGIGVLDRARWTSADGGATWTPASIAPGAPVAQIPAGAQLIAYGAGNQPTAVLTPDGISHVLTSTTAYMTPGSVYHDLTVGPFGGAYYLYDGQANTPGVQVSHDMGRTWQRSHVPAGDIGFRVLGSDGHHTFATAVGPQYSPWRLYASTDGIDWQRIPPPVPGLSSGSGFTALPSVGLLVNDGTDIWLTSGSAPPTRVRDKIRTTSLIGCGPVAVALRIAAGDKISIATTTDGTHWTNGTIH